MRLSTLDTRASLLLRLPDVADVVAIVFGRSQLGRKRWNRGNNITTREATSSINGTLLRRSRRSSAANGGSFTPRKALLAVFGTTPASSMGSRARTEQWAKRHSGASYSNEFFQRRILLHDTEFPMNHRPQPPLNSIKAYGRFKHTSYEKFGKPTMSVFM